MPPAVLIPAVLSLPVAGDVRAPSPAGPARMAANGVDPDAAQEFGRALDEAMQNPGKASAPRSSAPAEREHDAPDGVPVAVAPVIAVPTLAPAPAAEATVGSLPGSEPRVGSGTAGAHMAPAPPQAPVGKTLPIVDQALPRTTPAAPAPAAPMLTSPLPAQPTAAGASATPQASAATESAVVPGAAGAVLPATDGTVTGESAPGLPAVASRQPAERALPAPAGHAAAGAQPPVQDALARALDRAAAGTQARRTAAARASEATPVRAEAAVGVAVAAAVGGRAAAASAAAVEPAHGDADARRFSDRPAALPSMLAVPPGAADSGEPAAQPRAPATHHEAGNAAGVAMPVAMAVLPPAPRTDSAVTQPLAAGAATRRQQAHAPALQAGHPPAPPATQADARVADNATTPWLQALAEARELASERGLAPQDGDATGASAPFGGERSVTAVPALQALAVAATRAEAGAGPGLFAAPLAVGQAGAQWAGELEARVQWLAGSNLRSAEIQLDPPELGPLQVQVQSHRDGASVHFTTHSATVRDLVEQSLPRLREMLESSGMNLLDVNVAQHQGGRGQRDAPVALPAVAVAQGESAVAGAAMVVVAARGLVDAYA